MRLSAVLHCSRAAGLEVEGRTLLEGNIVVERLPRRRQSRSGKRQARDDKQIHDVVPVHEYDLTSLGLIQLPAKPISGCLGYFSTRNDERMIDQYASVGLRIEDFMAEHHRN